MDTVMLVLGILKIAGDGSPHIPAYYMVCVGAGGAETRTSMYRVVQCVNVWLLGVASGCRLGRWQQLRAANREQWMVSCPGFLFS